MIVQNVGADGHADISFTVVRDELPADAQGGRRGGPGTRRRGLQLRRRGVEDFDRRPGHGHADRRGRADVPRPGRAGINIHDDHHQRDQDLRAGRAANTPWRPCGRCTREFELDKEPPAAADGSGCPAGRRRRAATRDEVVARMERMEDLMIEDISARRVAGPGDGRSACPTSPGWPRQVFDEIAEAGIFVDMIVQSVGRRGHANISFTVPQGELAKTLRVAASRPRRWAARRRRSCPQVAKLSVFGVGMRSHTERGHPHVSIAGRRGDQRRSDQHHAKSAST